MFNYTAESGWTLDQKYTIDEMLEKFRLAKSALIRVAIGGEDGDKKVRRYRLAVLARHKVQLCIRFSDLCTVYCDSLASHAQT